MKRISMILLLSLIFFCKIRCQEQFTFDNINKCLHFIGYYDLHPMFFEEDKNKLYKLIKTEETGYEFQYIKDLLNINDKDIYPSWVKDELEMYIAPPYLLLKYSDKLDTIRNINIYAPYEYNFEAFSVDTIENKVYFTTASGIQDESLNWVFDKIKYIDLNSKNLTAHDIPLRAYNLKIKNEYLYFLNESYEGDQICRVKLGDWDNVEVLFNTYSWGWTIYEKDNVLQLYARIKLEGKQQNVLYNILSGEISATAFDSNRQSAPFIFNEDLFFNYIILDDEKKCKPFIEKVQIK